MHVHEEGVVGFEGLAGDYALADGHRVRDRPCVLGRREAAEAAVEYKAAADEIDDRARARFFGEPIVRLVAHACPDARAGGEKLRPDEFELVVVGIAAGLEGACLARTQP